MTSTHEAGHATRSIDIGNEPPLIGGGRRRAPDKREVSLRWLSGTALTGLTSTLLMSAALFAALDGRELLATPAEVATSDELAPLGSQGLAAKGARLFKPRAVKPEPVDRKRMSVSTVTKVGDSEVIRTKPFEQVRIALAAGHETDKAYPQFNPLNIFSEGEENGDGGPETVEEENESLIYGATVETEVSVRVADFDFDQDISSAALSLNDSEAEEIVRSTSAVLSDGSVQVASLHYVDPLRFGAEAGLTPGMAMASAARIVPQNMSIAARDRAESSANPMFEEDLAEFTANAKIAEVLEATGYGRASQMAEAIGTLLHTDSLKAGNVIRLGLQDGAEGADIVRASVYQGDDHQLTIALNDRMQYVPAPEPVDPGIMDDRGETAPVVATRDLPTAYDAIYRSVLSYDLPEEMAAQIIRMVAAEVDFQSPIRPTDRLELFFSLPEEGLEETADHELMYVEAKFGDSDRNYYRFRTEDGAVDYYDSEGRSARQFLLRNPVPNGVFRSSFGMRKHPILGYSRMHWGVDWSAPRGTPIIAAGNGVVEQADWSSGYGRQTIIRHANGYKSSYNHQSGFAKGVSKGAHVRQGQVIGYVGSTGLATGPHLHYELWVNGNRVDPLRVRLPKGRVLQGEELLAFNRERDRINALLGKEDGEGTVVAQAGG